MNLAQCELILLSYISHILACFQGSDKRGYPQPTYKHSSSKIVDGLSHPLRYYQTLCLVFNTTIHNISSILNFKSIRE